MATTRPQREISFRPSSAFRRWLRPGSIVRAVVLQPLGANTAVISVRGMTTVAASPLPLARGQVLYTTVADLGEKVHLRLVPPPGIDEASRVTTAAELARHLASIGIDPTDEHVCLAAAMLGAGLPITAEHFSTVARLAQHADGDLDATGAAAACVLRHGLGRDQATLTAVRAALFESPSLGELLAVLEAAVLSDGMSQQADKFRTGVCQCLIEVRSGGPADWLRVSAGLCGVDLKPPKHDTDLGPLPVPPFEGDGTLADAAHRLRTLLQGLHLVNEVPASGGTKNWALQVPFPRGGSVGTCFVELRTPDGPFSHASLARHCNARLWVPLEDSVVCARLRIRRGRAAATLHVGGAEEATRVARAAEQWLQRALPELGIELSQAAARVDGAIESVGPAEQPVPIVGLDFEV